ncbi:hypothetical protein Glove_174g154 [Diversispora epigaea]|uniref:Uncharacterized protein n=1 Tax=Diversispora epigaea TaxID=1348612 RepID=A0A397ISC3_9GLOM|nr:hypothetical protein Glove_174g154 [Diversispora epigaea]
MKSELDIYYQEYGFAIEVQGQQHEKYIKFLHRNPVILSNNKNPYVIIPEHLRELSLIE